MKKKALAVLLTASVIAGTMGGTATIVHADEEGKVINIYSWNDEFRQRLEAVYPEVKETSKDGTVTTLKDGNRLCIQIYRCSSGCGNASERSWN